MQSGHPVGEHERGGQDQGRGQGRVDPAPDGQPRHRPGQQRQPHQREHRGARPPAATGSAVRSARPPPNASGNGPYGAGVCIHIGSTASRSGPAEHAAGRGRRARCPGERASPAPRRTSRPARTAAARATSGAHHARVAIRTSSTPPGSSPRTATVRQSTSHDVARSPSPSSTRARPAIRPGVVPRSTRSTSLGCPACSSGVERGRVAVTSPPRQDEGAADGAADDEAGDHVPTLGRPSDACAERCVTSPARPRPTGSGGR